MIDGWKTTCMELANRLPVYRFIPFAKYRDYAAIRYFDHNGDARAITTYVMDSGRLPSWRYTAMALAGSAAFVQGEDALATDIATKALATHPEMIAARLLLSDIASYHGEHAVALRHAQDAWLISPDSEAAAARTLRLAYLVEPRARADAMALVALNRFSNSEKLLWVACKHCYSAEQFDRIHHWWTLGKRKPKDASTAARPLAAAALRAGRPARAMDIYAGACVAELQGDGAGSEVKGKTLAGKNGLSVLRDLRSVLESARVPFFFAAGTALGIVRNGRPLDHDNDIDVGIFDTDWDRARLVEIFLRHPNFDLDDSNPESPKIGLVHRGGANIDLFRFYREGEHLYHDAIFVRWRNRPFGIARHEMASGDIVFIPTHVDEYLTENYADWRVPDRGFDAFVDGPNVEVTWPEYFQVHKLRRAYKYIRGKDLPAAHRELSDLKDALAMVAHGRELIEEMQL